MTERSSPKWRRKCVVCGCEYMKGKTNSPRRCAACQRNFREQQAGANLQSGGRPK